MFEVKGKTYELKFNLKRIELIENALGGDSLVSTIVRNKGMMPISAIKATLSYSMKESGADAFVSFKKGQELAEKLIENNGYTQVSQEIVEAIERDCGFLFPTD